MPQYDVDVERILTRRFDQSATVRVEAANEAEARKKAEQLAEGADDWDGEPLDQDEVEEVTIGEVREVPPEEEEEAEEET